MPIILDRLAVVSQKLDPDRKQDFKQPPASNRPPADEEAEPVRDEAITVATRLLDNYKHVLDRPRAQTD